MFSESPTIQELDDFGQHYAVGDDPIPRESHIVASRVIRLEQRGTESSNNQRESLILRPIVWYSER